MISSERFGELITGVYGKQQGVECVGRSSPFNTHVCSQNPLLARRDLPSFVLRVVSIRGLIGATIW